MIDADQSICWLATTRPNGHPHLVPIWFIVDDHDVIWIATGADSVKVANIALEPRVQIGVAGGGAERDPGDVVITGTAEVAEIAPSEVLDRLESKYGWRPDDEPDPDIGRIAFIAVTPTRRVMGAAETVD